METKTKTKCRHCHLWNDREARCSLSTDMPDDPENPNCGVPGQYFKEAYQKLLQASLDASFAAKAIARKTNTARGFEVRDRVERLVSELAMTALGLLDADPDDFWDVPDDLGTCGDCARLDRGCRGSISPSGSFVCGKCAFGPPAHGGFIVESSWRGCARWARRGSSADGL